MAILMLYKKQELTDMYSGVITECLHYFNQVDLQEKLLPTAVNYCQREEAKETRRIGILILTHLAPLIEDKDFFKEMALRTIMGFFYEMSYELRKVLCLGCTELFKGIV